MASRRALSGLLGRVGQAAAATTSGRHHGFVAARKCMAWRKPSEEEAARVVVPFALSRRSYAVPLRTTTAADQERLSTRETRRLLELVNLEELKKGLLETGSDCLSYEELLERCKHFGKVDSEVEASKLANALDESGAILIFRNKVFLRPEKVANVLAKAIPLPLAAENDPRREELARMEREKAEIDRIAHKQVRRSLWTGLICLSVQSAVFFRLTFWELSWDVMEPITFFVTYSGLLAGYFFFLITSREPSYQDFMKTLFFSKEKKLIKKKNFDIERLKELQMQCYPGWRSYPNKDVQDASHAGLSASR